MKLKFKKQAFQTAAVDRPSASADWHVCVRVLANDFGVRI